MTHTKKEPNHKTKERNLFIVKKHTLAAVIAAGLITCTAFTACINKADSNTPPIDRAPLNSTIALQPEKAHFTFMEHSQSTPNTLQSTDKKIVYVSTSAEKVSFVAENRADRTAAKKINEVLTGAGERSQDIYGSLVESLDSYLSQENADTSVFPWEAKVDYTCTRNDGRAISVLEAIDSYSAGALEGTTNFTYNFDPATGDHITQIFYTPGDKESFDNADDVMYKKLIEKYGEDVISYKNVASSFVETAEPCWYFTENGIKIVFNPGSVADISVGTLELEYTKEELPELAQKYFN